MKSFLLFFVVLSLLLSTVGSLLATTAATSQQLASLECLAIDETVPKDTVGGLLYERYGRLGLDTQCFVKQRSRGRTPTTNLLRYFYDGPLYSVLLQQKLVKPVASKDSAGTKKDPVFLSWFDTNHSRSHIFSLKTRTIVHSQRMTHAPHEHDGGE